MTRKRISPREKIKVHPAFSLYWF